MAIDSRWTSRFPTHSCAAAPAKRTHAEAAKAGLDASRAGLSALSSLQSARTAAALWKTDGFQAARGAADKLNLLGAAAKAANAVGIVDGLAKLPKQISTFTSDFRTAVRTRSAEDWNQAMGSGSQLGSLALKTTKAGLETARDAHKFGAAYTAAKQAFRAEAPHVSKSVAAAASRAAAKAAFEGASTRGAAHAAKTATDAATRGFQSVRTAAGTGSRAAARAALSSANKGAAKAAVAAGARAAAGPVAKAAGRFIPGANVAIAGLDIANATSTLRDPNAGMGKKVTSVITAAGSVVAASNIPVVSQIGAAVSTVSGLIGSW